MSEHHSHEHHDHSSHANIPQDKKEQVINYLNLTDVKWEVLENKINNKELERA